MKKVITNSKNNTYNFCKGDIVFEINPTVKNAINFNEIGGKTLVNFLINLNSNFNMGWEMCMEENGQINGFVITDYKKDSIDKIANTIKNGLNKIYYCKGKKFITDTYQLI